MARDSNYSLDQHDEAHDNTDYPSFPDLARRYESDSDTDDDDFDGTSILHDTNDEDYVDGHSIHTTCTGLDFYQHSDRRVTGLPQDTDNDTIETMTDTLIADDIERPYQQQPQLVPTQVTLRHNTVGQLMPDLTPIPSNGRPWQDNFGIGDPMTLPKSHMITRIYFQNVNGITLTTPGTWDVTCEHIRDMEVDVALFAEHKLDTTQPQVTKKLYGKQGRSSAWALLLSMQRLLLSQPQQCTNQEVFCPL